MSEKFLDTGPHKRYPPFKRCIYCGTAENLSSEHIIPFCLGGNVELPEASCPACAKVTAEFERACCRTMMGPLRARLNLQTRRPKERPQTFDLERYNTDGTKSETLSLAPISFPVVCVGINLEPPRMIQGLPLTDRVTGDLFLKYDRRQADAALERGTGARVGQIQVETFCRLIAKIGHAHVMAALVTEGISLPHSEMFLPAVILGKSPYFQHYVGGDSNPLDEPDVLHQLRFNRYMFHGKEIFVSMVRLFACFGMPRYHVIACYGPQ
jgi:hypothetical protein